MEPAPARPRHEAIDHDQLVSRGCPPRLKLRIAG